MLPAEDGDDRAGSPVKGIKGRKDMHVPKEVWRKHRPPPPRAPDHVEGTGRGGGPTAARVVNGVLRSLSELTMTNPKNLKRWGLGSGDEYFEHVKRRDAAKAALDATLRDPSVPADDKHDAAASFSMNHGPAAFNCRKCWLLRGCCICRMFTTLPAHALGPHKVAVYLHHHEFGRGSSTGALVSACLGGDTYVAGLRKDEEALRALCERKGKKVAVLWPGEGAVSIGDLGVSVHSGDGDRSQTQNQKQNQKENQKETEEGYTFVAIDGTWKNARNMLKRLPRDKVTLVSLPPEAFIGESVGGIRTKPPASLLAPVRKYRGAPAGRTSTFEACVALLRALGVDEGLCEAQLENVKTKVDAVKVQKCMAPVYEKVTGSDFEAES